jgi:hypothetical protein
MPRCDGSLERGGDLEEEERWRCSGGGGWRWLEAVPLLPPPLFNVPVTPVTTKQQDDEDEESRRCRGGRGQTWLEAVGGRVGGDSGSSGKIRSGLLHPPIHVSSSRSPSPCSHSCFSWLQGTEEGMNESQ